MRAADLRKAILQAAVQGKLVPQDKNDEPACELLKRIQAEKTTLIKEGKLKKEKPLLSITADEIPYDLPDGWVWCRVQEISLLITSGSRDWAKYYSNNGARFIRMGNLSKDSFSLRLEKIQYVSPPQGSEGERTGLTSGDILVSITADIGLLGLIPDGFGDAYINQHVALVRTSKLLERYYIPYSFLSPLCKAQFDFPQRGIKNSFRLTDLSYILVPLPPLAEQQRIVSRVGELMAMCDELEAAEKELDALESHFFDYLPKSILQAAIRGKLVPQDKNDEPASELLKRIQTEKVALINKGKLKKGKPLPPITEDEIPYDLPEGWAWCRLGEVCELYTGSSINAVEKSKKYTGLDSGRCYIGTKDIDINHNIDYENGIKIPLGINLFREAPEGAVLLCIEGGSAGKKIGITNRAVCFGNKLCCFVSICIENKYLYYYLQSPVLIEFFRYGMTGIIGGVSVNSLKQFPIVIPPLAEQQRIVVKVDELMRLCDELKMPNNIPIDHTNIRKVAQFHKKVEDACELALVARGNVEGLSSEALEIVHEMFAEDDE